MRAKNKLNKMGKDFIIILAWPEGLVTGSGAWYDKYLATNGKYRVGHSALALVNSETSKIHYFDFGRYHTPDGFGRIRDTETDPDAGIKQLAKINGSGIQNIEEILVEISNNKSYHGEGALYSSVISGVNFNTASDFAKKWQDKGAIPYGPFIRNGTNCSRFVATISRKAEPSFLKKLRLKLPFCISPSPKRNVSIANTNYYIVKTHKCQKINRSTLKAYFSGIEKNDE
jgi:hypothetical protein